MNTGNLNKILACPDCLGKLKLSKNIYPPSVSSREFHICYSCQRKFIHRGKIPIFLPVTSSADIETTQKHWNKNYSDWIKGDLTEYLEDYRKKYLKDTLDPIKELLPKKGIYCEIGCGPGINGAEMAKMGFQVVGIDLSFEGLKLAQNLYNQEKVKGLLVCGDILKMPFKDNSFDLIYGGGVLEHFKDTFLAVKQLHRVLKENGHVFLTIPFVSLSTLTYRQAYGNIPDLPILGKALEFIHVYLLKGKYMKFGYEKSFTEAKLKKLFKEAGFKEIKIDRFKCHLPFNQIKNEKIKNVLREIARHKLFWPMVYVLATK